MSRVASARNSRARFDERLAEARARTDELFALVPGEGLLERPIAERHRLIFYLGHLEAFDWNLIGRDALGRGAVDPARPELDRLFAFGIDPTGDDLPTDRPADWPAPAAVLDYVARARAALAAALGEPGLDPRLLHAIIEHRLMHAETLAYLLHRLPRALRQPDGAGPAPAPRAPVTRRRVTIPAGRATLGLEPDDEQEFGWDNELGRHVVEVPSFAIDSHDVTAGMFGEFVGADAYRERSLWSAAGWAWIEREGIAHPPFWVRRGESWSYRTLFGEIPLPLDWPVYVSHAEASAYARWAGLALPTEAQFHRAAYGTPGGDERSYPWGEAPPSAARGNFDFARWTPLPVGSRPEGDSAFGVSDLLGNGWEWTSSLFGPFPGFTPFAFYPGYSAPFFAENEGRDAHYVLKGAAARTAACFLRRSFRNWFQPHYPHVDAGFRCVEN